jgi:hypothetical protein
MRKKLMQLQDTAVEVAEVDAGARAEVGAGEGITDARAGVGAKVGPDAGQE